METIKRYFLVLLNKKSLKVEEEAALSKELASLEGLFLTEPVHVECAKLFILLCSRFGSKELICQSLVLISEILVRIRKKSRAQTATMFLFVIFKKFEDIASYLESETIRLGNLAQNLREILKNETDFENFPGVFGFLLGGLSEPKYSQKIKSVFFLGGLKVALNAVFRDEMVGERLKAYQEKLPLKTFERFDSDFDDRKGILKPKQDQEVGTSQENGGQKERVESE